MTSTSMAWTAGWRLGAGMAGVVLGLALAGSARAQGPEQVFARFTAGSAKTVDHAIWDRQTKAYVVAGPDNLNRVRYPQWKSEGHAELKTYVKLLEATDVAALDRPEQFAFWANLYNAKTIDIVLDKYPIKSIKDISLGGTLLSTFTGGPWKAKVAKVAGQDLSLDDIENSVMRPIFKDPRVHYSVNCASVGCPNLMRGAFTGAGLEAQLDAGAKAFVNHPRGIAVEAGRIKASNIFSWFEADFGGSAKAVLAHVGKHAEPALKAKLEGITTIADYDYDWNLNEAK